MTTLQTLQTLSEGIEPLIPLPETRFTAAKDDPPFLPPPYSSMVDDAFADNRVHLYKDRMRQIALHPVRLQAGQSESPAGGLGRFMLPAPLPEMRGGKILSGAV